MVNRGGGFAGAAAQGIMGYLKGMQMTRDMERDDEERKAREEDRAYTRDQRSRETDERRQMQQAARPVDVQQGAGGVTLPESADNRDVGQPDGPSIDNGELKAGYRVGSVMHATQAGADQAAADQNTPEAVTGRQVSVLRAAGKPLEAQQLESSQLQGKAAKLTLEKAQQDFVNEKFDNHLKQIATPSDAAQVLSGSALVGGRQVEAVQSADGKKTQFMVTEPDGSKRKFGDEFDNSASGVQKLLLSYSAKMDIGQKVAGLQHLESFAEQKAQNEWSRKHGDATLAESTRHAGVMEGQGAQHIALQGRTVSLAETKHADDLKNDPTRVLPPATKMMVQGLDKTIATIDTAIANASAQGQWDPKAPGAADLLAQRNKAQRDRAGLLTPYMKGEGGSSSPGAGGRPSYQQLMNGGGAAPGGNQNQVPVQPAAGRVMTAATQAPSAVSASPVSPAGSGAATPAAPTRDPVLAALNPSGNASLDASAQGSAATLSQAANDLRAAQAEVVSAASNGGNIHAATQKAQAAMNALDELTKDMEPGMAKRVRQAIGL